MAWFFSTPMHQLPEETPAEEALVEVPTINVSAIEMVLLPPALPASVEPLSTRASGRDNLQCNDDGDVDVSGLWRF
ncbi:hypothetical protein TSMEX_004668 [Taenia solium]|eukprot:TsM_000525700 transcript=TsM_000525700 gene=TsM_000525700